MSVIDAIMSAVTLLIVGWLCYAVGGLADGQIYLLSRIQELEEANRKDTP